MTQSPPSDEPCPPWIKCPDVDADWAGWRQGAAEDWLVDVWLPFWLGMTEEEKSDYLLRYPVPDEDWRMKLEMYG